VLTVDDLQGHEMIGFSSSRTGQAPPLEFMVDNQLRHVALPARITVTNSETYAALARLGFGLIQAPRYHYARDLAAGALAEVLPDSPHPRPRSR
jgi:DNA-binding transcriptional LysR family regulator